MDETKRQKALKALAITHLFQNGMMSPNQNCFDSRLARMLLHPNFRNKGICLRDLKELYFELSEELLAEENPVKK